MSSSDPYLQDATLVCKFRQDEVPTGPDQFEKAEFFNKVLLNCLKGENWQVAQHVLSDIIYTPSARSLKKKNENYPTISLVSGEDLGEWKDQEYYTSVVIQAKLEISPESTKKRALDETSIYLRDRNKKTESTVQQQKNESHFLNIFLKIYCAPFKSDTQYWYESQIYQYVIPRLLKYSPHLSRALLVLYNINETDIDKLSESPHRRLKKLLKDIYPDLTSKITNPIDKSISITITEDVNGFGPHHINQSRFDLGDFLNSPTKYLTKPGELENAVGIFYAILFQLLWTLEVMNRNGIRHNDLHLGNALLVLNDSNERSAKHTFVYHLDDKVIGVCSRFIPFVIDFDRSWAFELKWFNTALSEHTDTKYFELFGESSRINPEYDTTVLLLTIHKNLDKPYVNVEDRDVREKIRKAFSEDVLLKFITEENIKAVKQNRIDYDEKTKNKGLDSFYNYPINKEGGEFPVLGKTVLRSTHQLLTILADSEYLLNIQFCKNIDPARLALEGAQRTDYRLPPKIREESLAKLDLYNKQVKMETEKMVLSEPGVSQAIPESYKGMRDIDFTKPPLQGFVERTLFNHELK